VAASRKPAAVIAPSGPGEVRIVCDGCGGIVERAPWLTSAEIAAAVKTHSC
jgi:hypothetical protein